ncbi:hypothetical protein ACT3OH_05435 [Vreelandella zhanjiangensis]|uniref:hypothetical protein n=1 Tax=Vreelandella zhanjiangensis TaxID=1121960 RepID=UPI00402AE7D7
MMDAIQCQLEDVVTLAETLDGFIEASVTLEIKLHGGSETRSIKLIAEPNPSSASIQSLQPTLHDPSAIKWF